MARESENKKPMRERREIIVIPDFDASNNNSAIQCLFFLITKYHNNFSPYVSSNKPDFDDKFIALSNVSVRSYTPTTRTTNTYYTIETSASELTTLFFFSRKDVVEFNVTKVQSLPSVAVRTNNFIKTELPTGIKMKNDAEASRSKNNFKVVLCERELKDVYVLMGEKYSWIKKLIGPSFVPRMPLSRGNLMLSKDFENLKVDKESVENSDCNEVITVLYFSNNNNSDSMKMKMWKDDLTCFLSLQTCPGFTIIYYNQTDYLKQQISKFIGIRATNYEHGQYCLSPTKATVNRYYKR